MMWVNLQWGLKYSDYGPNSFDLAF